MAQQYQSEISPLPIGHQRVAEEGSFVEVLRESVFWNGGLD